MSSTADFLRKILPASGLYIIARLVGGKFRHQVCESIEEAAQYALNFDGQGVATYHACAAYRERGIETKKPDGTIWHQVRTHKNVRSIKAFWMDLDVEPGNPAKFESQEGAIGGLVAFCAASGLPIPMVVSSGGGVHIYWTLNNEILPEQWRPVAEGLKTLAAKLEFKADPACTSDPARVLRPVGTWNRKDPNNVRPVELIADSSPVGYAAFAALVQAALKREGIKPPEGVKQVEAPTETINQEFAVKRDFPPCSGEKVASRCKQLAKMRDTKGNIPEPAWYAGIQLLCHSVEGDALIHEWSKGYDRYSVEETQRKISQIREQSLGPTLCSTFESRNSGGCAGCPFLGKISSPAQLGAQIASAPAPVVQVEVGATVTEFTLPPVPEPFTRGANGGIYVDDADGITHKIYEYDCYPTELAYDEQLGYETVRIRHQLPQEGWRECVVRSSLLASPKDFETALRDQHIQPLIRNKMAMYFDSYLRKIRQDMKLRKLFRSQGWKTDTTEFVLGDKLYRQGEVVQAGWSHGVKGFLEHFRAKGDLQPWRELTWLFNTPGLEPHAFMFLTAFAAPLLKLDSRDGFVIAALGDTGVGKSTMGKMLASVYGHPDQTWIKRSDTLAARVERIGAYYSLPVYMDEITTIAPKELRDLVYSMSTGKGRDSLKQDRTLREGVEWSTILVTSTNDSLQSKLQLEKSNPEAEAMRLFEFRFPRMKLFTDVAGLVHSTVGANYGVAGAKYIQHIVDNRDRVAAGTHEAVLAAERDFGMDPKERFWSQAAALTLYGGQLAREAGLIDFDPERIRPWLMRETHMMRAGVAENVVSAVAVLSAYLDEHVGERLVVSTVNVSAGLTGSHARPTRGELSQRYEKDVQMIWVSRKHIKTYMDEHHMNYNDVRDDLSARGILLAANENKSLGRGTDYAGGAVPCWRIKADHPELNISESEGVEA